MFNKPSRADILYFGNLSLLLLMSSKFDSPQLWDK